MSPTAALLTHCRPITMMAEGSERSAPIDRPSWTVDTRLRILTQRTNGLPARWQPDARPRTIPAPRGVMHKREPINTSILHDLHLPAASAISAISTVLRGRINSSVVHSACDFSSVRLCSANHSLCVSQSEYSHRERDGAEAGEGRSGLTTLLTLTLEDFFSAI